MSSHVPVVDKQPTSPQIFSSIYLYYKHKIKTTIFIFFSQSFIKYLNEKNNYNFFILDTKVLVNIIEINIKLKYPQHCNLKKYFLIEH